VSTRALLIDLDDTLVVEEPAAAAAFLATARAAAEDRDLDAHALAATARSRARELWYAAPTHPFCKRIGISSWEGLWCRYEGEGDELRALRAWAPEYRREAWRTALADQGIDDDALAAELGERFGTERRALCETFADAAATLDALRAGHAIALVTNGASCLQREKLAASGLGDRFDAIVVSGDIGRGKPDAAIFAHALRALGAEPGDAVMVGDNLEKDVDGALAAGLDAIWLNRDGKPRPADRADLNEIARLEELPAALA
jgi:putative hydrolase of the HAD superfamily